MVSSSDDTKRPIDPEVKKKLTRIALRENCFTLGEFLKISGEPEKLVLDFLADLCHQGTLKYVNGQYQHTSYSENRFV